MLSLSHGIVSARISDPLGDVMWMSVCVIHCSWSKVERRPHCVSADSSIVLMAMACSGEREAIENIQ